MIPESVHKDNKFNYPLDLLPDIVARLKKGKVKLSFIGLSEEEGESSEDEYNPISKFGFGEPKRKKHGSKDGMRLVF